MQRPLKAKVKGWEFLLAELEGGGKGDPGGRK